MKSIERFAELTNCKSVEAWRDLIFRLGKDLGYEQTLLAIFPNRNTPIEAEYAFLHSNYSSAWRNRYDAEKMGLIDPTVIHCASKSTPLIWSPGIFSAPKQKEMYEEACRHGLCSGITLPIHGTRGELGILCFATGMQPDKHFQRHATHNLPELSFFRDFIFETSLQFMKASPPKSATAPLTLRELECLKWCAEGKSSWEIGLILNCAEATVNFHFINLRRKFSAASRQQAVAKAIRLGLIHH